MGNELAKAQNGSAHLSADRIEHRTWIKGRAATLLGHYWREDDDPALLAAMGKDWADVLEGLPQNVIQQACIAYQRREARKKPTPGAIYQLAIAFMPRLAPVDRDRPETRDEKQKYIESTARDNINQERRDEANRILKAAGFSKRIGGGE